MGLISDKQVRKMAKKKTKKQKSLMRRLIERLGGLILILIFIAVFAAVAGYHPQDPGANAAGCCRCVTILVIRELILPIVF